EQMISWPEFISSGSIKGFWVGIIYISFLRCQSIPICVPRPGDKQRETAVFGMGSKIQMRRMSEYGF
ncbi:hypothetical protein, partial [Yersinia intermedia]|uniref:hypothetical protein n=1 Tax=Yersinia intermedia TaxID=631 RepID=UPI0022447BDA